MINTDIIISKDISLLDSLAVMDRVNRKLLIVCENRKFLGVISIGDIQRALLKKADLSGPVSAFVRKNVTYATVEDNIEDIKNKMITDKIEAMPVIDSSGFIYDIIEWDQLFEGKKVSADKIDYPVVIMAGGKGTRLLPLTNIIPKPLVPISDKTIIEEIMGRFKESGCHQFYLSVNYLTNTIKEYFEKKKEWDIEYIEEEKPLGTGGSLFLLKNKIDTTFFVTNCDALIDVDLNELINYHKSNKNVITVISAVKTMHIPYGTIETSQDGIITNMKEKPDYVYQVNSGFYVVEPMVLNYIEDNKFLNFPDLVMRIIGEGMKVGAFPVSAASWVDMGNWDEYMKLVEKYRK